MTDFQTAKILSHQRNIQRYARLLKLALTAWYAEICRPTDSKRTCAAMRFQVHIDGADWFGPLPSFEDRWRAIQYAKEPASPSAR
jgi:hypothetical protein